MADLIDRQQAIDAVKNYWKSEVDALHTNPKYADFNEHTEACDSILTHNANICKALDQLPSAQPEIIRCKDCIHQEKFFHEDKRRKNGGHYIYGCELADGYSHVCLDDDYCSRGERRTDDADVNTR